MEVFSSHYLLIQEADDISGDAGGDKRPLANTFDALRKQEREYNC